MSEWLDKLTERLPWLSLIVHFLIAAGMIGAVIALSCLAEWIGRVC